MERLARSRTVEATNVIQANFSDFESNLEESSSRPSLCVQLWV